MLVWLLWLFVSPAQALSVRQSGPSLDLGAGLGVSGTPAAAGLGMQLSAGWWFGTYDESFALGKYWWIGPTGRADLRGSTLRIAPMIEVRRGLDVIVAGVAPLVAVGVVQDVGLGSTVDDRPLGFTGRVGLVGKFRRHRYWGITLRLEGGVDLVDGTAGASVGTLIGIAFAKPSRQLEPPQL